MFPARSPDTPCVQVRYKSGEFFVSVSCADCVSFKDHDGIGGRCAILDGRRVYQGFGCKAFLPSKPVVR